MISKLKVFILSFCILFICFNCCLLNVSALTVEEGKIRLAEINNEISVLESKVLECDKNKDLVHNVAKSACNLGFTEDDYVILKAVEIWNTNNSESLNLKLKIEDLKKELEEYRMFSNMTYVGEFKLTGYCACKKCCGKSPSNPNYGITAMGSKATEGITVAMDKRFPFGTKVYIEGLGVRTVEDRGGAIKGNRVDVFVSTHSGCFDAQYNRKANVYIINE